MDVSEGVGDLLIVVSAGTKYKLGWGPDLGILEIQALLQGHKVYDVCASLALSWVFLLMSQSSCGTTWSGV